MVENVETQTQEKGKGEETTTQEKSVVELATELRDEIKAEREKLTAERQRMEELTAKQMLGGRADAGQSKPTPEEQEKQEASKIADEITGAFK